MSAGKHTPMVLPECSQHGQMELQPPGTPEQAFCGIWYRCSRCTNTTLFPSAAAREHRELMLQVDANRRDPLLREVY